MVTQGKIMSKRSVVLEFPLPVVIMKESWDGGDSDIGSEMHRMGCHGSCFIPVASPQFAQFLDLCEIKPTRTISTRTAKIIRPMRFVTESCRDRHRRY